MQYARDCFVIESSKNDNRGNRPDGICQVIEENGFKEVAALDIFLKCDL
jgi:hypothetical protein